MGHCYLERGRWLRMWVYIAGGDAIVIVDLVVGPLALTLVVRVVIILQGVALVVFVVLVVGLLTLVVGHDVRSVETVGTWPKFVHVVITSACLENFHEDMQPLTCPPPTVSTGPTTSLLLSYFVVPLVVWPTW